MDVIDDAAKTEAKFQQMALANHRARAMQTAYLPSRTHCLECDDPIPKERQEKVKGVSIAPLSGRKGATMNQWLQNQWFQEWFEKLTSYIAYLMSGLGVFLGLLSIEQWISIFVGVTALVANIWHKRAMQKIAKERGIYLNENN